MKNRIKVLVIALVSISIFGACEKFPPNELGDINIERTIGTIIHFNAVKAGGIIDTIYSVPVGEIKKIMEEKGSSNVVLSDLHLSKIELTIPDDVDFGFEDMDSMVLSIGGIPFGVLPPGASGKVMDFVLPSDAIQQNFKDHFFDNRDIVVECRGKAKNDIPECFIHADYSFKIHATILLD